MSLSTQSDAENQVGKTASFPIAEAAPVPVALTAYEQTEGTSETEVIVAQPALSLPDLENHVQSTMLASYDQQATENHALTLQAIESLAMTNNASLKELAATTQKAAGFRTQVGLKPNPTVGYQAQQLADQGTDQHLVYAEQEIVTGGKLQLNRRVQNEALRSQLFELEAQRFRVINDIRSRFYQALALQRQEELVRNFQEVANKGYELAVLRREAAEGSQIDVLQASIQRSEIDLALRQLQLRYAGYWRELFALAGVPDMPVGRLQGDLPNDIEALNWDAVATSMVSSSPEYAAAQARISQAYAALRRHSIQPTPNVRVQLGAGVDNGTDSGMINLQAGVPVPVHNKNQGNIHAAQAELCRAQMEAARIEQSIKARLAAISVNMMQLKQLYQLIKTKSCQVHRIH